jgi:AcrR family transcriptional regulator
MASLRQEVIYDHRAAASQALVDAAKELLADHPPSAITGRQIARAAGVNYGLLHRHFGTKAAVLHQALDELTHAYFDDVLDDAGLPVPLGIGRHRTLWRALIHMTLDRASFAEYRPRSLVIEHWLAALRVYRPELSLDQARTAVALGSSVGLGLVIHRPSLATAVSLAPDDDTIDCLTRAWLVGLRDGHGPLGDIPDPGTRRSRAPAPLEGPVAEQLRGRAAVEARLVRAAAALLVDREPSAISGRLLAREAGVNYGLIHHYFGSKDHILRRAVQVHRDEFFAATARQGRNPEFFSVCDHPGYVQAITRAAIHPELAETQRFPAVERMVDTLVRPDQDQQTQQATRVAVLVVAATQMAWALFAPILEQGLNTDVRSLEPIAAPMLGNLLRSPLSGVSGSAGAGDSDKFP